MSVGERQGPAPVDNDVGPAGRMDVRLWLRLLSCSTTVEKRLRRGFVEKFDTTLPRFDVLAALDRRRDGMTMGQLSQALLVSNGNITAVVRQLQSQGLLTLEPAPGDRRTLVATLTPLGAAHFQNLTTAHHAWIGALFAGVSDEDKAALFNLLGVVRASLAQTIGAPR